MTASAARTALAETMAKAQEVMTLLNSRTAVEKAAQETCRQYSVASKTNADTTTANLAAWVAAQPTGGGGTAPAPAPVPSPAPAPSTPGTTLPDGVTSAAPTTDKASYVPGETASVSAKLTVTGKATTARVIIAVRSPVNSNGMRPYHTLYDQENVPMGVGVLTFNATYKFPADVLLGAWEFYVAYLLPDGSWFNSLNTSVNVAAAAITPAPSPTNPVTFPTTEAVANEGGAFTLTKPEIVKFLSPSSGLGYQKLLGAGTFPCNTGYFGEPAFGEVKKCYIKQASETASLPAPIINTNQIDGTAGGSTAGFVEGGTGTTVPTNANLFDVIRVEGNSISQSAGNNPNAWPKQLGVLLGSDVVVTSYALSSTTLVQMKDNYGAGDHAGGNFVTGKRNLCILGPSATNDFTQNNASIASLQFNLKTFFDKAKATGYTVWDSTELPRAISAEYTQEMEDKRVQLNAWKRANWATYCHKLIDFESVVTLAMLYDGIHPGDNPGAKVMAEFVYPMVRTTTASPAPAPSVSYFKPDVVIFEGDSIPQAYGVELGGMAYRWKALDGNNNAQIINIAREGSTCRDIDDDFNADGSGGIDTGPGAVFVANKVNAVVLMIGTNDLANSNTSLSAFTNHMKSLSTKTRARGAKFWLQTILKRADANWDATKEALRVQLNNWILAGGEGYLDGFINNENVANNTTNFKDGIHPTPAGNDLIAANIDAAFKAKTVTSTSPAPAPAPSTGTPTILNSDGTVNVDLWTAMAAKLSSVEGMRYRYGEAAPNVPNRTMWYQPGNHPWPQDIVGTHSGEWQHGTFTVYTDGYFMGGDFASNSLIVSYVADDPNARIGVTALQCTSTDHGTFTQKPELPWVYYGGGLDAEETLYWKLPPQNKVVKNPTCSANALGKPGWAVQPIQCFQNGFMATAGFNTMKNKSSCQLPSGLVPSCISVTSSNEFALVGCWDTTNKRGVVAVVSLCGLGHAATIQNQDSGEANGWWGEWNEAHPGLPNLGNLVFMKCIGVVPLPGMMAPTEITSTTHHSRFGYLDGSPGEPSFGNMKFNNSGGEDRRRRFIPGGDLNRAVVKQGECLVISKSEKKAIWINLKPLFDFNNYYYFSDSRSRYEETRNIGLNAGQWPYTFTEQPSQIPTITKTMTFDDEPTSVFMAPYAKQESWRQAWITFKGGKCRVFNTGGVNDTGNAAAKVEVGNFDVGPNCTKITWVKEKARSPSTQAGLVPEHTRQLLFCIRGEAAIKWFDMNSNNTSATERRKFQDPRVIDPISVVDSDNHGGEHYVSSIIDFNGRCVHNVRWGDMIMWTYPEKTRIKMGANGTDPFEYCGKYDFKGYPFIGCTANVS